MCYNMCATLHMSPRLSGAANPCGCSSPDAKVCVRTDAAYKAFLEELERQPEALPTAEQQLDQKLEAGKSTLTMTAFAA